ncbi:expressed unknown protein [Ectocarpus siliculosus]|uniref:Uncharacterized protein n=1 Tax=Ectocarpus siliculosus TaxID=2880 RepID=D7G1E5_ECTSI|nr:expressed unknown protein [Ectocarpus siliculosus]|eukprot:CBJ33255.1 expressed unknown protein [Ectocarpus siliculosus]
MQLQGDASVGTKQPESQQESGRKRRGCSPRPGHWSPQSKAPRTPGGIQNALMEDGGTATAATGDTSTLTGTAGSSVCTPEPGREKTSSARTNHLAGQLPQGNMLRPPTIPGRRVNEHPSGSGDQEAGGGGSSATDAGSSKRKGKGAPKGGSAKGKGSSRGGKSKAKGKGKAKEITSSGSATKPPSPSCHAKAGATVAAWEAAHGGRDKWNWHDEEKYELLRAFASCEQRGMHLGPENLDLKKNNERAFELWKKFILPDVVARLNNNDKYLLPPEYTERKFMHAGNYCHIKNWVFGQKREYGKEVAARNTANKKSGAAADEREDKDPTPQQVARDDAFATSATSTMGINNYESPVTPEGDPGEEDRLQGGGSSGQRRQASGADRATGQRRGNGSALSGGDDRGERAGRDFPKCSHDEPSVIVEGQGVEAGKRFYRCGQDDKCMFVQRVRDLQPMPSPLPSSDEEDCGEDGVVMDTGDGEPFNLDDDDAEVRMSQNTPEKSHRSASPAHVVKATTAKQAERKGRGRKPKTPAFNSESASDLLRSGKDSVQEVGKSIVGGLSHIVKSVQQIQARAGGGSSESVAGSASGGGGGSGSAPKQEPTLKEKTEAAMTNQNFLKLQMEMARMNSESGLGVGVSEEEFKETMANCRVDPG